MPVAVMETLITITDIIMLLRDIMVMADIGGMTGIITEMMLITITTTEYLIITTIIITQEERYM